MTAGELRPDCGADLIPLALDADRAPIPNPETPVGLTIWTDQGANRCTLRLRGRLDAQTVVLLSRHVDFLGCQWCDEVLIDLEAVTAIDRVGANCLVGIGHYVRGRGGRFRVVAAGPLARSMLAEADRSIRA
ncbi:MAG: STAS domain-containing protein [Acidobacteriota bacterium]|nr:STAS domain-containing protein [Acidobacteriota bacterium]